MPERLAKLVASKEDGTRLIHLVHLNCEDEESQKHCGILREQAEAIDRMRSTYPDTIIVKSATAVGWRDQFTHWWATNGEYYQRSLSYIGAFPLMYGGGHNTFIGPVRKMDLARAMVVIGQHPDSDGHDFELFNENCYNLAQMVEYMYDCKWSSMEAMNVENFKVPGVYQKRDVDLDLFQWDVLGEMDADRKDLSICQRVRRKMLRLHLAKLNWPRASVLGIRLLDYMKREGSMYYDWTNEDHFNLMNMSHKPSFQNPGFKELGVEAHCILPTVHETATGYRPGTVANLKLMNQLDQPPVYDWKSDGNLQLAS